MTSFRCRHTRYAFVTSFCVVTSFFASAGMFVRHANAQVLDRRQLEHKDYDRWNTMTQEAISRDGNWVSYTLQSGAIDGEATLHVHRTSDGREYVIPRGSRVRFTFDSRFAIYLVTPEKQQLKELRKKKTKTNDLPKPVLNVLELSTGELTTIDRAKSFSLPEENGDWLACLLEKPTSRDSIDNISTSWRETYEVTQEGLRKPEKKLKLKSREKLAEERGEVKPKPVKKKAEAEEQGNEEEASDENDEGEDDEKEKAEGAPLVLVNLESGVKRIFPTVASFAFSKHGESLAFVTSVDRDEDDESENSEEVRNDGEADVSEPEDGVTVIELETLKRVTMANGVGQYKNLAFNEDGTQLAFITNKDDYDAKTSAWSLYYWQAGSNEASRIATEGDEGMIAGWWIATDSRQSFSEDGKRLYFETAPIPDDVVDQRNDPDGDSEDEDEDKAKLDIWHWQDAQLQPEQLLQAKTERNRDYSASYVFGTKKIVQLESRDIPELSIDLRSPAKIAVANTNLRYRKTLSWDRPGFQDAYLINLDDGTKTIALQRVKSRMSLSPEGKYITWFDGEQRNWFAKSTDQLDAEPVNISEKVGFALQDELHDTPNLPDAYGAAGWTIDDKTFLVYDRYDLWQLDPSGQTDPICLTGGFGRKNDLRFRYLRLDSKQRAIDPAKTMMLEAFNRKTKASGFYELALKLEQSAGAKKKKKKKRKAEKQAGKPTDEKAKPGLRQLILLDESLGDLEKAQDGDKLIFTRQTFRDCPDVWTSDTSFKKIHRVSDMNPQQNEYSWGTAELVHWNATDGQELDGILIKPDGFDPAKKYPMMVYFYERKSDTLHSYYTPAAGRSIICHSFYASRGYLVFIPDIPYSAGAPGPSAANSVIPGVEYLIEQGFVDAKKVGMQGHSWGGYQTAYLVTQTDMFACAESGAPVSNMTSAYGGIRWGTGLSRMFQYERTQSRIGDDLWSARDKYIANSPLFFADKINTPLLILHNDEDGAVPWYQGIELFVALRRLEKPAWMLNYNGNPHWVTGDHNRRDFATRMQQFFDHYLKDAPEPEWMAVGVRAVDKGEKFGLELLEPEKKKKNKRKSKEEANSDQ